MKARLHVEAVEALTWYNDNYLMVNLDKFQLLMINPHNDDDRTSFTISAYVIERSGDISLLGINVDKHLVFSKDINELRKKIVVVVVTSKRAQNHEMRMYFSTNSIVAFCHISL